jgi:hypothetical protein
LIGALGNVQLHHRDKVVRGRRRGLERRVIECRRIAYRVFVSSAIRRVLVRAIVARRIDNRHPRLPRFAARRAAVVALDRIARRTAIAAVACVATAGVNFVVIAGSKASLGNAVM